MRSALLLPSFVVGSRISSPRLPVGTKRSETSRRRPILPTGDRLLGVFQVRQFQAVQFFLAFRMVEARSDGIAGLGMGLRLVSFSLVGAAKGPFPDERHGLKWRRRRWLGGEQS